MVYLTVALAYNGVDLYQVLILKIVTLASCPMF
jgi:hypothetical protein